MHELEDDETDRAITAFSLKMAPSKQTAVSPSEDHILCVKEFINTSTPQFRGAPPTFDPQLSTQPAKSADRNRKHMNMGASKHSYFRCWIRL